MEWCREWRKACSSTKVPETTAPQPPTSKKKKPSLFCFWRLFHTLLLFTTANYTHFISASSLASWPVPGCLHPQPLFSSCFWHRPPETTVNAPLLLLLLLLPLLLHLLLSAASNLRCCVFRLPEPRTEAAATKCLISVPSARRCFSRHRAHLAGSCQPLAPCVCPLTARTDGRWALRRLLLHRSSAAPATEARALNTPLKEYLSEEET